MNTTQVLLQTSIPAESEALVELLATAALRHELVAISYKSLNDEGERIRLVNPLSLRESARGRILLHGISEPQHAPRAYGLDAIAGALLTGMSAPDYEGYTSEFAEEAQHEQPY